MISLKSRCQLHSFFKQHSLFFCAIPHTKCVLCNSNLDIEQASPIPENLYLQANSIQAMQYRQEHNPVQAGMDSFQTVATRSTVKSLNDVRSQVKSAYQSNSAITDIDVTFDEAALKLWQGSEDSGFRYTTLLSDGDAKTYHLNTKEVYGPEIKIKIEDCINHVRKRLGTSLRKAVKEWRARGVSLGGKSRGSLKEETIKKLSQYYQNAIHWNKGDVEAMKTAIYATLFHSISMDQKPQHFKCPTGKDSWCFFQAALARGEVPGPHVKHVKTPLKETHLAKIMPIYQRLASNELLHRCIRCVTQKCKRAFTASYGVKCSKETSATLRRVTIAVCDAVCEFNFGTKNH
ncbi:uncharacterized protein TNCV_1639841 [Trichonephila clavipes]|nr:uncharacterized protein TNCV_1639841 [Trichonephila clavipes]